MNPNSEAKVPPPEPAVEAELVARAKAGAASLDAAAATLGGSKWVHALRAFDRIALIVHGASSAPGQEAPEPDPDIREMLLDARDDLVEACLASATGRKKAACASLRGLMEGLFSALLYRQQAMSLNLWAADISFHMVHSLFEDRHEFYKYYKRLFEDERFTKQYPGVAAKVVFKEAVDLYDVLSAHVHKKKASVRNLQEASPEELLERVFRIFLAFLEREDDLPSALAFPDPITFPAKRLLPAKRATK